MGKRRLVNLGLWVGSAFTVIRTAIWWIGDIQTVQQLFEDRATVMGWLSATFLHPAFGPTVVVLSLGCYWYLEHYRTAPRSSPEHHLVSPDLDQRLKDIEIEEGHRAWVQFRHRAMQPSAD